LEASDRVGVRREAALHAYYDKELSGLRRWWFERRLDRSPELRAQLKELEVLTALTRESEPSPPSVDLWDSIALRLPALDAQRAEPEQSPAWTFPVRYVRPLVAVAVTAVLVVALLLGGLEDPVQATPGMIRWLDTGGRSVIVLEQEEGATIVWLLDSPQEGASVRDSRESV
jgi:anti-sigma-K factor RskA